MMDVGQDDHITVSPLLLNTRVATSHCLHRRRWRIRLCSTALLQIQLTEQPHSISSPMTPCHESMTAIARIEYYSQCNCEDPCRSQRCAAVVHDPALTSRLDYEFFCDTRPLC